MTEGQSPYQPPESTWHRDLSLDYEVAQARARRERWQSRYEQFLRELRPGQSDTGYSTIYTMDYTGLHFTWMRPQNLGDYILFRLDMMERSGGSEPEKHWRAEIAATGRGRISEDGAHLVQTRVLSLTPEVAAWGHDSLEDLQQVQRALSTAPSPGPRDVVLGFQPDRELEPPPVLIPRQTRLLSALQSRAERYNDPRWQRWTRKARERAPGPQQARQRRPGQGRTQP